MIFCVFGNGYSGNGHQAMVIVSILCGVFNTSYDVCDIVKTYSMLKVKN